MSNEYGIPIPEDAAETMGSTYCGQQCGTLGEYGVLSFNGNKMITTSGGGDLICSTKKSRERAMFYATQAREDAPYYQHEHIGYNYHMSNISAGIGRGPMKMLEEHITRRRENHCYYMRSLSGVSGIEVHDNPRPTFASNFWLTTIQVDTHKKQTTPEEIKRKLDRLNIESRLLWKPLHMQPVFTGCPYYGGVRHRSYSRKSCACLLVRC